MIAAVRLAQRMYIQIGNISSKERQSVSPLTFLKKYDIIYIENRKKRYKALSILNVLTSEDRERILSYISLFGPSYPENCSREPSDIDTILAEWDFRKSTLYNLLGGHLTIARPYTYKLTDDMMQDKIRVARRTNAPDGVRRFLDWCLFSPRLKNSGATFIYPDDIFWMAANADLCSFATNLTNDYNLATNSYEGKVKGIKFADGEVYKLNQGMRIMRILAKLVEKMEGPKEDFEEFRIWHSRQFQDRYVDGELCLSIHPLDYMTMSDNDNNWESCMRWMDGSGDYRVGTVECMNSPYIIVAYLHSPKHTMMWSTYNFGTPTEYTWNSKQWRELFLVQEGVISEIYGYPFQDENLTNTTLMWIKELAAKNLGWTYDDEEINTKPDVANPLQDTPDLDSVYFDIETNMFMYQDLGRLAKHRGRMNSAKVREMAYVTEFPSNPWDDMAERYVKRFYRSSYGGVATCMCCGKELPENQNTQNVYCPQCESVLRCCCCGEVLSHEYAFSLANSDDVYCEDCFNDVASYDSLTQEPYLDEDLTFVYWLLGIDPETNEPIFAPTPLRVFDAKHNDVYHNIFSHLPRHVFDDLDGYPFRGETWFIETSDIKDYQTAIDIFFEDDWHLRDKNLAEILAEYSLI